MVHHSSVPRGAFHSIRLFPRRQSAKLDHRLHGPTDGDTGTVTGRYLTLSYLITLVQPYGRTYCRRVRPRFPSSLPRLAFDKVNSFNLNRNCAPSRTSQHTCEYDTFGIVWEHKLEIIRVCLKLFPQRRLESFRSTTTDDAGNECDTCTPC